MRFLTWFRGRRRHPACFTTIAAAVALAIALLAAAASWRSGHARDEFVWRGVRYRDGSLVAQMCRASLELRPRRLYFQFLGARRSYPDAFSGGRDQTFMLFEERFGLHRRTGPQYDSIEEYGAAKFRSPLASFGGRGDDQHRIVFGTERYRIAWVSAPYWVVIVLAALASSCPLARRWWKRRRWYAQRVGGFPIAPVSGRPI